MSTEPAVWNIILNGAWNLAILTPAGIRNRLFEKPADGKIELEMDIDHPGQYRVGADGIKVTPRPRQLDITPTEPKVAHLLRAATIAARALTSLPVTPVSSVGVNLRFSIRPVPDTLIDLLRSSVDNVFSDATYEIVGRSTRRTLALPPGVLNVEIIQDDDGNGRFDTNFHCSTNDREVLLPWLGRVEEFYKLATGLLNSLGIPPNVSQENENGRVAVQ